jgi:coiled-coil domain-containing protein 61
MVQRKQKELDVAVVEVNRRRDTERDLRVKIKDLSTEVDGLQRRMRAADQRYANGGGTPRASSRSASPARGAMVGRCRLTLSNPR